MFGYCFNHLSSIVFPWHISPTTSLSKYSDSYILNSSITAYLGRLVGFCFFHHDLYHDDSACDDFFPANNSSLGLLTTFSVQNSSHLITFPYFAISVALLNNEKMK